MKLSTLFKRIGLAIAGSLAVGVITFGIKYEYTSVNAWNGTQTSDAPSNYYSSCEGLGGSALANKLYDINQPKNPSYDWSRYEAADEMENDSTSILCVYTRHAIKKSSHVGSYSWNTWNREHVWTQTAYPASNTDNHNIFACEGGINNTRNNYPYGEVPHNSSTLQVMYGHDTGCYFAGGRFEPNDEAKGEIARAVLYGVITYKYNITNMFTDVSVALKWHLQHPVTNRDIYRNNTVYRLQGNRNPLVDNPSYACKIWGNTNETTKALCSGNIVDTPVLTSIVVSTVKSTINVGESTTATASAVYSDGSSVDITNTAVWTSGNNNIIKVEKNVATGLKEGKSAIRAAYQGIDGAAAIDVVDGSKSLVLSANKTEILVNRDVDIVATYSDSNVTNKIVTDLATWTTSDKNIADVAQGYVVAKAIGEVTITATYENTTASIVIKVVEKSVTPNEPQNPSTGEESNPKSGCFGSIAATSGLLSLLSIAGVSLLSLRRKN